MVFPVGPAVILENLNLCVIENCLERIDCVFAAALTSCLLLQYFLWNPMANIVNPIDELIEILNPLERQDGFIIEYGMAHGSACKLENMRRMCDLNRNARTNT